jgi:hypothetical protein
MKILVTKQIGNAKMEIEVSAEKEKEALAKALFYMQTDKCLHKNEKDETCGNTGIVWESNKAQTDEGTFTYIKRRCLKCGATSTAGEYKEGGYFWKRWEIFKSKDNIEEKDMLSEE